MNTIPSVLKKIFFHKITKNFFLTLLISNGFNLIPIIAQESTSIEIPQKQNQPILYYQLKINDKNAGWFTIQRTKQNQEEQTTSTNFMQINRLGNTMSITTTNQILTNNNNQIKQQKQSVLTGKDNLVEHELTISAQIPTNAILTTKKTNSSPETKEIKLSHELTSSQQILSLLKKEKDFKKGFSFKTYDFDFSLFSVLETTYTYLETKEIKISDKKQMGYYFSIATIMGNVTVRGTAIFDENYDLLFQDSTVIGIKQTLIRDDEGVLSASISQEDAIASTFIKAPNLSKILSQNPQGLTYLIEEKKEKRQLSLKDLPCNHNLKKQQTPNGLWEISIFNNKPQNLMSWPYQGTNKEALNALQSTYTLEAKDPEMKKLAIQMIKVEQGQDAYQTASLIANKVYKYIYNKNYKNAYNTALQTLKSRAGDCTEHSVLATALCRSLGIPARPVFGIASTRQQVASGHSENLFIGHQWFEVWINGEWYPLDPALLHYSLCHIRLGIGDGSESDGLKMLEGYECIEGIKIISVTPIYHTKISKEKNN